MCRMDERYSIRELNMIFQDPAGQIRIGMTFAANHGERLTWVEKAIDHVAQELARTPQYRQERGEDDLSTDLVSLLKIMGFQASHDTAYGGHCDIVIEGRDNFLWLGEAKIHTGYDWLYKGFEQLDTRYATAMPGQDAGGMIIYSFNRRADQLMEKWKAHLQEKRAGIDTTACPVNPLAFVSSHPHERTGRQFRVRHVPIPLWFDPKA